MNTDNIKIKFCPVCGSMLDSDDVKNDDATLEEVFEEFSDSEPASDVNGATLQEVEPEGEPLEEVTPETGENLEEVEPLTSLEEVEEVDTYEDNLKHRAAETLEAIASLAESEVTVEKKDEKPSVARKAAEYFDKSYKNNMKHNYLNSLWNNADEKYVSIDKGYAPNILENTDKVEDISNYQQNLQAYNNRIKAEISGIKPQLQVANANVKQRKAAEWDKRVKSAKRNVTLKNIIALSVAVALLILGIIVTFAIKNTYKNVPFLDGLIGGAVLSFYFLTVTVSVFAGMSRQRKVNKYLRKNKKPVFMPTSVKFRRFLSFLMGMAGIAGIIVFISLEASYALQRNGDGIAQFTANPIVTYIMCLLIGVCFGGGVALVVRALLRLFQGRKSNKGYSINYGDEASLKYLKKRGVGKLVAVIIFSVIFVAGGIAGRVVVNEMTKPYYSLGFLSDGQIKLTGMDESEIEGKTEFELPPVSALGKNFLPKDNEVETLVIPEYVKIDKGALGTAQKLKSLTVKLTEEVTLDYLFDGKIPETLTTVNLYPYAPSFIMQSSQSTLSYGIPDNAFKGASGLSSINVMRTNYRISTLSYVGRDAFEGTVILKAARKENGVSYIFIDGKTVAVSVDKDAKDVVLNSCHIVANGVFAPLLNKKINSLEIASTINVGVSGLSINDKVDFLFGKVDVSSLTTSNSGTEICFPSETYLTTDKLTYDLSNGMLNFKGINTKTFEYTQSQSTGDIYMTNLFGSHYDNPSYINSIETIIVVGTGTSNTIATDTFDECVSLKSLYIKGSISQISGRIFGYDYNANRINVFFEKEEGEIVLSYNWYGNADVSVTYGADENTANATVSGINYTYNKKTGTAKVTGTSAGYFSNGNITLDSITMDGVTYKVTEIAQFVVQSYAGNINLTIGKNVQIIADEAFQDCTALKTVTFEGKTSATAAASGDESDGLTVIGTNAFHGCINLLSVTLNGVKELGGSAFSGCTALETVTIEDDSLTTIGDYCFLQTAIKTILIPSSVSNVGQYVFGSNDYNQDVTVYLENNDNLSQWTGNNNNLHCETVGEFNETTVDGVTFKYAIDGDYVTIINVKTSKAEVTIPGTIDGKYVTKLLNGAFDSLVNVTKLNIALSDASSMIEHGILSKLQKLQDLTLPNLQSVSNAYGNGTLYQTVAEFFGGEDNIPETLKKITVLGGSLYGNEQFTDGTWNTAFMGCDMVETLVIGENVITIGDNSLSGLTGLKELTLPRVENYIGRYFSNYPNASDSDESDFIAMQGSLPATLKKITVTGAINNQIPTAAFKYCSNISDIVLGEGIIRIEDQAFAKSGLVSLTIGQNILLIGMNVFDNCDRLLHIRDLSGIIYNTPVETRYTSYGINEDVEVVDGNGNFSTQITENGGVSTVIKADGKKYLLSYSGASDTLDLSSSGIYGIEQGAFVNSNLKWVILPSSLKEIASKAFVDCNILVYVYVPSGVDTVGTNAFYHCRNTVLLFPGSVEPEWTSNLSITNVKGVRTGASANDVKAIDNELVGNVDWFKGFTSDPAEFKINGKTAFIATRNYPDGMDWNSGIPDSTFDGTVWYSDATHTQGHRGEDLYLLAQFDCQVYIKYGIKNSSDITVSIKVNDVTKDSLNYRGTKECTLTIKKGDKVTIHYNNDYFGICYGYVESFKVVGGFADRTFDYTSLPSTELVGKSFSSLTNDNGKTLFTANASYWENTTGSGNAVWQSTNKGHGSTSTFVLTAACDCFITIRYGISSENGCDRGTIKVDNAVIVNGISGSESGAVTIEVKKGQNVILQYVKDMSSSSGQDRFYITSFVVSTEE